MNKNDKDRFYKQLAIRFCISEGHLPCPEVVVYSPSDLTDTPEHLTDLDVLGLEALDDGRIRRTLFDCKTGKMSAINRALWARGLMEMSAIDHSVVILNKSPVENHRLAATAINVDLHSESTFSELAALSNPAFDKDTNYQSNVERWQKLQSAYEKYSWTQPLFVCVKHLVPVTESPAKSFRRLVGEIRQSRGEFDPGKVEHRAILYDATAAFLILWCSIARDVRRIFRTNMSNTKFLEMLRFYLWGGREAYGIRRELAKKLDKSAPDPELPEWGKLEKFASHAISYPKVLLKAAFICRELALRELSGQDVDMDAEITRQLKGDGRLTQVLLSALDYITSSGRYPREAYDDAQETIADLI